MKRLLAHALAIALGASAGIAVAQMAGGVMESQAHNATNFTGVLGPSKGGSGVANSKNLTWSNSLTLAGTDATTMTFPPTNATIARTDKENTFLNGSGTGNIFQSTDAATLALTVTGNSTGRIFSVNSTGANGGNMSFGNSGTDNGFVGSDKWLASGNLADFGMQAVGTLKLYGGGSTTKGLRVIAGGPVVVGQMGSTQATVPTCTTNCGTGSPTVAGSDTAGIITLGTTPASAFQVNFNGTWAAAPSCIVQSALATMVVGKMPIAVVTTTTTMTVTTNGTAPATSDKYQFHCIGVS